MKTTLIIALVYAILAGTPQAKSAPSTNYIWSSLGTSFQNTIINTLTGSPSQLILEEGVQSFTYSSARMEPDYFLIPTSSINGGRLLRMSPFTTSDFFPWYGIMETNATFTDATSGEVLQSPLNRIVDEVTGAVRHEGTLLVDGRYVYIVVRYTWTPRYPTATLTWGIGSTYGDAGLEVDTGNHTSSPTPIPPNQLKGIHLVSDETGSLGVFLTLDQPFHSGHQIDMSPNLVDWSRVTRTEIMVSSDGRRLFYGSGQKSYLFFRLVW